MFREIFDLLSDVDLRRLQHLGRVGRFVDGRSSNPHSEVKHNSRLDFNDGLHAESARTMALALQRDETFRNFAFPNVMAPPMITKYAVDKHYGLHSDAAFMPIGERPLRSDLSCTLFISPPDTYDGGELSVAVGDRRVEFKGPAGSAVVYPSDTLHEVRPVTRGERVVGLTFIESRIADHRKRELLYALNEVAALEGLSMQRDNFIRLQHVQMGLLRMWADPG